MKQRMAYLFVGMLAGIHLLVTFADRDFKQALGERIVCAVEYYEEKAYFLYLKYTGKIPPEIVLRHRDEWDRFNVFCDAIMLEREPSQELFEKYISSARSVNTREVMRPRERRRRRSTLEWHLERQKRQEKIVASFASEVESDFTSENLALMKKILMQTYVLPDADLRALRNVRLSVRQRESIRPYAVRLVESLIAYSPKSPGEDFYESEKDALEADRKAFLVQASGVLRNKQKEYWRSLREKAQDSVNEYRDRIERRNRFIKLREEERENERLREESPLQNTSHNLTPPYQIQSTPG